MAQYAAMARVALVTCEELRQLEPDERALAAWLGGQGAWAEAVVWDEAGVDWGAFDLILLRTCWDYYQKAEAFYGWLDGLEAMNAKVWNPAGLVRWNAHKGYLLDLERRGVPVIPVELVRRGETADVRGAFARFGGEKLVIKPAMSAGAWLTGVLRRDEPGNEEKARALAAQVDLLMQPFLEGVANEGELSLMYLAGEFSHAVMKCVAKGDFRVQHQYGGVMESVTPEAGALQAGARALAAIDTPWLYARVDLVREGGRWLLMEIELIEPAMFLDYGEGAVARFGQVVLDRLSSQ